MSGNAGRSRGRRPRADSWESVASWYDGWVGERGSRYHRATAIPVVLDLLRPDAARRSSISAGQGVLAPYVAAHGARYMGIDASPGLVAIARRRHGRHGRFLIADTRALGAVAGLRHRGYDAAVFLLSIQDMGPLEPIFAALDWALRTTSRVVLLMTHPAFRQPAFGTMLLSTLGPRAGCRV